MSEMARFPDRMEKVPAFFNVIESNVLGWVSAKIDQRELKRALRRVKISGSLSIDWDKYASPYFVTFRALMDMFHIKRKEFAEIVPLTERVDFWFDQRADKNAILKMWDSCIKNRPDEIRELYGARPKFEDEMEFLPLQAADCWAWWVRKWY